MVILNATPDSFSDGLGGDVDFEHSWKGIAPRLEKAAEAGAALVDLGAESTRPGAEPVPAEEEWRRLRPFLKRTRTAFPKLILSIDTTKAEVFRRAVEEGADWLNDVSAGEASGDETLRIAAQAKCPAVLMHRRGTSATMHELTDYGDVVAEVEAHLQNRTERAIALGIPETAILWDPGLGFAKTAEQNLQLIRAVEAWNRRGKNVLIGASRKRMIGEITGRPIAERMPGSLGVHLAAAALGAKILRCHDAWEFLDAWKGYRAVIAP